MWLGHGLNPKLCLALAASKVHILCDAMLSSSKAVLVLRASGLFGASGRYLFFFLFRFSSLTHKVRLK